MKNRFDYESLVRCMALAKDICRATYRKPSKPRLFRCGINLDLILKHKLIRNCMVVRLLGNVFNPDVPSLCRELLFEPTLISQNVLNFS